MTENTQFTIPMTLWSFGMKLSKQFRFTDLKIGLFKTPGNTDTIRVSINGPRKDVCNIRKMFLIKRDEYINTRPTDGWTTVSHKTPAKAQVKTQVKAQVKAPAKAQVKAPAKAPAKAQVKTPVKTPAKENTWATIAGKQKKTQHQSSLRLCEKEKRLIDIINTFAKTDKEQISINNLDNLERKFIHTKVVKYGLRSRTEGDGRNKNIIIYRTADFLTNERKTELEGIIREFSQSKETQFYLDIKTKQEILFFKPLCEINNIDFIQVGELKKPTVVKRKGETCWDWMNGKCTKGENCEYEHEKTTVCKHWQKNRCKFQDTPKKCCNLHGIPAPKPYTEEELTMKRHDATWGKLPINHIIPQEEWREYVLDVFNNLAECMEILVIPVEEIVGWEEDIALTKEEICKHWYGEIPIKETKLINIQNPVFFYAGI